jgi:hypothetical protein
MKRKTAALLLTVVMIAVVDSHVDWTSVDGKSLLNINGQAMDPVGWFRDKTQNIRHDCKAYGSAQLQSPVGRSVMAAVARHSPPDSAHARWHQARQDANWLIAELSFERLSPAVVLFQRQGDDWHIHPKAIWSGSTEPWFPSTRIRDHLMQQAPEAPQGLIACFTPEQDFRAWAARP